MSNYIIYWYAVKNKYQDALRRKTLVTSTSPQEAVDVFRKVNGGKKKVLIAAMHEVKLDTEGNVKEIIDEKALEKVFTEIKAETPPNEEDIPVKER